MMNRTRAGFVLLVLAQGLTGCDDSRSPVSPGARTATAPGTPGSGTGELIRGTVSDTAFRPLAGARVELIDGPQAGMSTTSDAQGSFFFTATVDDTTRFRASKEGHVTGTATIQPVCDRCNPKRWVHIYLNVLASPVEIAGDYTLTFIADSTCVNLPDELQTRSYAVTIGPADLNSDTSFKVAPVGSAFPGGLNNFYLYVAGNYINVSLGDHTDPGITERVAPDTYFAFGGWTVTTVETPVSRISVPFQGWIDHCVNPQMGERYDCTPSAAVTLARCDSVKHQLILARR
jgi:carboxypeptidase family protein